MDDPFFPRLDNQVYLLDVACSDAMYLEAARTKDHNEVVEASFCAMKLKRPFQGVKSVIYGRT